METQARSQLTSHTLMHENEDITDSKKIADT